MQYLEREIKHPILMTFIKSQTEYLDFHFSQCTWPLSRRSVGLHRLFHAEGSAVLLLRQQHTLIHCSSKIVHMAVGDLRERKKPIRKLFMTEEVLVLRFWRNKDLPHIFKSRVFEASNKR